MDDDGIREAIAAELRSAGVGKGCASVGARPRGFIVTAIVGGELRSIAIPEKATAATVKKRLKELTKARSIPPPARLK